MFKVTEKAMRPASDKKQCIYCQQPIGSDHKADCVMIKKKVKVRMVVEYVVDVPASWGKDMIEFHRNDGSWCANNAITELEELFDQDDAPCMCNAATFEYLDDESDSFLDE